MFLTLGIIFYHNRFWWLAWLNSEKWHQFPSAHHFIKCLVVCPTVRTKDAQFAIMLRRGKATNFHIWEAGTIRCLAFLLEWWHLPSYSTFSLIFWSMFVCFYHHSDRNCTSTCPRKCECVKYFGKMLYSADWMLLQRLFNQTVLSLMWLDDSFKDAVCNGSLLPNSGVPLFFYWFFKRSDH